ncbi:hypothetical protein [Streptomyces sp. NPDC002671]
MADQVELVPQEGRVQPGGTGPAPLLLGGCLWLVVSATSLAVQFLARYL